MKVLLCGLGNMGSNHLRVLTSLTKEYELAAVVDLNKTKLDDAKKNHGVVAYTDLKQALDETKPEAAIVACPTAAHYEPCVEILNRKIPLLVEKPITKTLEQSADLEKLAAANKTPFMVGHIERFNPAIVAVRELLKRGELGDLISISIKRVGGSPRDRLGAGDVLVDLAVHDIDIIHWLTGEKPKLLEGVGHVNEVVDSATMLFQCGQTHVDIHVNWVTPVKIRQVQLTGTKGFVDVNLITQQVHWTKQNPVLLNPNVGQSNFFFDEYLLSFATPDRIELGIARREPLREELRAFHHAVQNKTEVPVTAKDAILALDLASQARQQIEKRYSK